MPKKIDLIIEQQIIKHYLFDKTISMRKLSSIYGIGINPIRRIIYGANIEVRNRKPKKLDISLKPKIVQAYLDDPNISVNKLIKKFNLNRSTVFGILKQYKIKCRPKTSRKYNLNQNYFDNIDCEEKAYFLGFIFADGCNYRKNTGFTRVFRWEWPHWIFYYQW